MARPKKSEARDTRQDILDAALDLFAESGFFGTSMREIARAVGVRESALYHHFESKEAILETLVQSFGPGQARNLADVDIGAMVEAHGAREFLELVVSFAITSWMAPREQKFVRVMLSEGHRLGERNVLHLPTYMRAARKQLSGIFEELQKRKLVRRDVPALTLTMNLMGPLFMLRMIYLVMPKGPPDLKGLQREVDAHLDFFWKASQ